LVEWATALTRESIIWKCWIKLSIALL